MYTMPGLWSFSLQGTPCTSCGKPASRLTVFTAERVIDHEDEQCPPCQLSNPMAEDTQPLAVAELSHRAA